MNVGDCWTSDWGTYRVHRRVGDQVVLADLERSGAYVVDSVAAIIARYTSVAHRDIKPANVPPAPRKAKPKSAYQTSASAVDANRAYAATLRPACPAAEACQYIALFFPGKHYCGALECPPECPKIGGHPSRPVRPQVVTADLAPDREEYSARATPGSTVDTYGYLTVVSAPTQSTPENMPGAAASELGEVRAPRGGLPVRLEEPEDEIEAEMWREAVDRWVADDGTMTSDGQHPRFAAPAPAPAPSSAYPPCIACGLVKIVMAVIRSEDGSLYTMCARCYSGGTK